MKRGNSVDDILCPLDEMPTQAYLSNAVQLADILDWVLDQVGIAKIWQTSFSISEEFLRRLFFIEKKGNIKEFLLVLDHKATNKTLRLWAFITQVVERTYLADNHSKVLLIEAESGQNVAVITSQNLTRGNRYESAVITTDSNIFSRLKAEVSDLIRNHSVPLHDLFERQINFDIKDILNDKNGDDD